MLEAVGEYDLVVNATPVGMGGTITEMMAMPLPVERLSPGQIVADLIYHPIETALLKAAGERGVTTIGGLGMLLYQAGLAFEHWTGETAPIPAMREAVLKYLS